MPSRDAYISMALPVFVFTCVGVCVHISQANRLFSIAHSGPAAVSYITQEVETPVLLKGGGGAGQ